MTRSSSSVAAKRRGSGRVDFEGQPEVGDPQLLFEGRYMPFGFSPAYDVAPDAQRLLMIRGAQLEPVRSLGLVTGWHRTLGDMLGTR